MPDKKLPENLALWNKVYDVDPKMTKQVRVNGKQPFTNIDTYELIRMATEQFGEYGKGFGVKDLSWSYRTFDKTEITSLDVTFFYPDGEFPYRNELKSAYQTQKGYMMVDEDAPKKLITNTIAKCLSMLGFGASVYMGKFEDQEYMAELLASQVELIAPAEVGKLLKGIEYYKVDKETVLKNFSITHLKELPKSELSVCEAYIKKIGTKTDAK